MGFLTKEEMAYVLEGGESWDGKTVYDYCGKISKKC